MDKLPKHFLTALDGIRTTIYDPRMVAHLYAVVVKGGKIISTAPNTYGLNEYCFYNSYREDINSVHAEINSIFRVRKKVDLTGAKMYVARITKNNVIAMARPCPMCQKTIKSYGFKRVFYTIDKDTYGTWIPNDPDCLD
jgi:deoxycytidylate deaminase